MPKAIKLSANFDTRTIDLAALGYTAKDYKDGDKINLSAVFADFTGNKNSQFSWIGKDDFSHTAGELHYVKMGDQTYIEGDVSGGGSSGFTIICEDVIKFDRSDFIL